MVDLMKGFAAIGAVPLGIALVESGAGLVWRRFRACVA